MRPFKSYYIPHHKDHMYSLGPHAVRCCRPHYTNNKYHHNHHHQNHHYHHHHKPVRTAHYYFCMPRPRFDAAHVHLPHWRLAPWQTYAYGVIVACHHHRHRPPHRGQTAHITSSPHGRRDAKNVLTALRVRVRVCEEAGAVLCVTCAFFSRTFSHIRSVCVRVSSSHWCNIVRACVHL